MAKIVTGYAAKDNTVWATEEEADKHDFFCMLMLLTETINILSFTEEQLKGMWDNRFILLDEINRNRFAAYNDTEKKDAK